jgi:hypothetical protein
VNGLCKIPSCKERTFDVVKLVYSGPSVINWFLKSTTDKEMMDRCNVLMCYNDDSFQGSHKLEQ